MNRNERLNQSVTKNERFNSMRNSIHGDSFYDSRNQSPDATMRGNRTMTRPSTSVQASDRLTIAIQKSFGM